MATDRELLIQAAEGQELAFSRLYQRYANRLFAYFLPRCGGGAVVAEDLCQQVFLQLLESRAFQQASVGPDSLSSLLFTIAANLLKNRYRSEERRARRELHYQDLQQLQSSDTLPDNLKPELNKAIDQLPDQQRQCVILKFRRGLSLEEIAETLACPPGTVKSRLHYGLKKLASLLNQRELFDI